MTDTLPTMSDRAARHARWAAATEWPLAGAAMLFLVAYSWQVIANPAGALAIGLDGIVNAIWLVFVADYIINVVLAEHRWRWVRTHLLDLATVALPFLRPLRLLRLLTVLRVLQRHAGTVLRGNLLAYVGAASLLLVYISALAILDAERGNGTISTLGDALWWGFVTVTTVGYGDFFPASAVGRAVAVFLMIGGIALIGVVTGSIASWIVEKVQRDTDEAQSATKAQVRDLHIEVAALRADISRLMDRAGEQSPPER
tara:strand:- start:180 stop:950 length:771 start_codon:yes stop_codon:yes gene_type:complete